MSFLSEARKVLRDNGFKGWRVIDDSLLESPNGHLVEWDGTSPDGEESPFLKLGMI